MDTPTPSRRALKLSEDKEDRLQRRREREKARRVAETAEERQERLAKRRERDRARCSIEADNKSRTANERDARLQQMRARQCERLAAETTIICTIHIYLCKQSNYY